MPGDLSKKPDLLIVSDTPMWDVDGQKKAFEPVIREIEVFYPLFNKITWIGFRHDNKNIQDSAVSLKNAEVDFLMLDNIGGGGLLNKIKILLKLPGYCRKIYRQIKKHDVIHSRGPSLPAFFSLYASKWMAHPTFWYKYAGNWDLENPPYSYKLQKNLLKRSSQVIGTINGKWPAQQQHLLSFENPCFTEKELASARKIAADKTFEGSLDIVFVGRIELLKGFDRLLDALSTFEKGQGIGKVYFVGGGVNKSKFEQEANQRLKIDFNFTGPLKRNELNAIYAKCHVFCLPSLSEGFPKVLAESASFGCVPVVSDLSCIGQYILHKNNGLLLKEISGEEIAGHLRFMIDNREDLALMSEAVSSMTDKFTYEYYTDRIQNEIVGRSGIKME